MKQKQKISEIYKQIKKNFGGFNFEEISPPVAERILEFEFDLRKCCFSLADSNEIASAYMNCVAELLIAQQYYKSGLAKDRMDGRLPDHIFVIQYHLEQMVMSGIMGVSKPDYDTAMKVLCKLRDSDFEIARILAKFTRNKRFSNRAIHLVHKKAIDLMIKTQSLKSAFAQAVIFHKSLFPEAPVQVSTIKVEYYKIKKSMKIAM